MKIVSLLTLFDQRVVAVIDEYIDKTTCDLLGDSIWVQVHLQDQALHHTRG